MHKTLVSALHFAPAALGWTIGPPPPASSEDLRNNIPTRLPAARTPKAATPVPPPRAARPQALKSQISVAAPLARGGGVPGPPQTSPLPRNLALPSLITLLGQGRLDCLRGRASLHQAPPGPHGSAPSAARPPARPIWAYAEEKGSTSPRPGTYSGR